MNSSTNNIALYQMLNTNNFDEIGIVTETPVLSYQNDHKYKSIEMDNFDGVILMNAIEPTWSPKQHNLNIRVKFTIEQPYRLFGKGGVTMPNNKIGLAAHIHSKASQFQKTINLGILKDYFSPKKIFFDTTFEKGELRGEVYFDFYLYLNEINQTFSAHADKIGMRVSENILEFSIVVDGDGSIFPMSEFSEPNGPLWRLEKNWVSASTEAFDESNINIALNIEHELFPKINEGRNKIHKRLMLDIMIQAMSLIIQQVIHVEENTLETVEEEMESDSILAVVYYWIRTFNIDTSSLISINNSLLSEIEKRFE